MTGMSSLSHIVARIARIVAAFTVLAATTQLGCSVLPSMRKIDALVTAADTMCNTAPAAQKVSTCRRALSCAEPARRAQHAAQAMLLVMAKMEDSTDDRLAASAAYAGAVAACAVAGVKPGAVGMGATGAVVANTAPPVVVAPTTSAPTVTPAVTPSTPVVTTPTTATPAPAPTVPTTP